MQNSNLNDLEARLYKTLDDQRITADNMIIAVNTRNAARVDSIKRGLKATEAGKKTLGFIIFAASVVGAFIVYKILGVF